jgi:hypothetical protein
LLEIRTPGEVEIKPVKGRFEHNTGTADRGITITKQNNPQSEYLLSKPGRRHRFQ